MDGATLSKAMLGRLSAARYAQLAPGITEALVRANCTTVDRAAMFCAQVGTESGGLQWMEELASGAEYEGRTDLGNTHSGDGKRFKGRGPIQITGRNNYTRLSQWAHSKGYVPTATFFVDHPEKLAQLQYVWLGPVWYWTVARNMNSYADRGDIRGATIAVNGGTNGLADRAHRWNVCRGIGSALLAGGVAPSVQHANTGQDLNAHLSTLRVRQLQKELGVEQDGIAGPITVRALEERAGYRAVADGTLPRGGSATVRKMQTTLILSEITKATGLVVDGILGPETDAQIERYMHGGGRFVNLAKMPTGAPKQTTPSPAPKAKPTSTAFPLPKGHAYAVDDGSSYTHSGIRGTDSTQVRRIQKKVGVAADGIYGAKTKAAVAAQQRKHHLTADGEVGPTTWAALGL